jgi:phosphoribosyl-AMP cyclohydrolase
MEGRPPFEPWVLPRTLSRANTSAADQRERKGLCSTSIAGADNIGMTRPTSLDPAIAARLKRDSAGLVVAVVQQHDTKEVLMVGWMDDEALRRTLSTGRATYWSRSRQEYWVKGETSGHRQWVKEVRLDCDGDALLVKVDQEGAACHTGARSCFDSDVLS